MLGSGLMGSLSGSAVANAVTTGSFTIPMMRNSGFSSSVAGGITAAAASGGALVPPVMGAGAYMMLEFVKREPGQPEITFLEIAKSAVIPALLYYFSLWMIVHFYAGRVASSEVEAEPKAERSIWQFEGLVFFGALGVLVALLVMKFTPFKAVTGSLVLILLLSAIRPQLRLGFGPRFLALLVFGLVTFAHQFTTDWRGQVPDLLNVFPCHTRGKPPRWIALINSPYHRVPYSIRFLVRRLLACFGLLIFGLIHPVWRPQVVKSI